MSVVSTSGVKSDFAQLLKNFTECGSVRFEDFAIQWKRMKMSFIFAGKDAEFQHREFVEGCFKIAVEYCKSDEEFQNRIGGLYILYALYYKQPLDPPTRIRVVPDQWRDLVKLLEEIKQQKHLDAEYIFTKLRVDGAFQFTVTTSRVILSKLSTEREGENQAVADHLTEHRKEPSLLSDIMEPDTISQLSALHEQYHRMKCYLAGKYATEPDSSLALINNDLVQNITKSVASFEEFRKTRLDPSKVKTRRRHDSGGTTTTSESEGDSDLEGWRPKKKKKLSKQGELRANLKQRAYSMPVANRFMISQHRTSVATASDSAAESEDIQSPSGKPSDTDDDDFVPGKKRPRRGRRKSPLKVPLLSNRQGRDGHSSSRVITDPDDIVPSIVQDHERDVSNSPNTGERGQASNSKKKQPANKSKRKQPASKSKKPQREPVSKSKKKESASITKSTKGKGKVSKKK